MEERMKALEGKIAALENTVMAIDKALGVVFQWALVNKSFMDALQVNKPTLEVKPEARLEEPK